MRLAREYERAEGRDLRGFLAYAADARPRGRPRGRGAARVRGARRGAADDDPPREGARVPGRVRRRPRPPGRRPDASGCCSAPTARSGCGSRRPAAADACPRSPTSGSRRRAAAEEDAEERRLFYVAMTRARDRLILSGDHRSREARPQPRPGGPPLDWIAPALLGGVRDPTRPERVRHTARADGRPTRVLARLVTPATIAAADALTDAAPAAGHARAPRCPPRRRSCRRPSAGRARAAAAQLHRARPVRPLPLRFYLQRSCAFRRARRRSPRRRPPPRPRRRASTPACAASIAHRLLEELDFARPGAARARRGRRARRGGGRRADRRRGRGHPRRSSPRSAPRRCARASPPPPRRPPRGRRSRSRSTPPAARWSPASSTCSPAPPDGATLIVDYKTDRLGGAEPARRRRARLRDPAHRLRARRAARRARPRSRSPTASSSARTPRSPRRFTHARRPRARRAPHQPRRGRARGPPPGRRRAPPRALRRLPGPRGAVLVARGDDAARAARA